MRPSHRLIGSLVLVGGVLAGVALVRDYRPFPLPFLSREAASEVRLITASELKRRLDRGDRLLVVDIRRRHAYNTLHLTGAVSMPMEDHAAWGPKLSKAQTVVLYCT